MGTENDVAANDIDIERLSQTLDRTTTWIENCDTKVSIILGGIGVILSIVLASDYVSKITKIWEFMSDNINFWKGLYIVICAASLSAIIAGSFYLLLILVAKTDTTGLAKKGICGNSFTFFSAIAKQKSLQDYKGTLVSCSENDWVDEIISQIYICALICDKKFRNYKIGLILSVIGFSVFAIMMVVGAFAISA